MKQESGTLVENRVQEWEREARGDGRVGGRPWQFDRPLTEQQGSESGETFFTALIRWMISRLQRSG